MAGVVTITIHVLELVAVGIVVCLYLMWRLSQKIGPFDESPDFEWERGELPPLVLPNERDWPLPR